MAENQPYHSTRIKLQNMKIKLFFALFTCSLVTNSILSQNSLEDTLRYEIIYDLSYQENKEDTLNIQSEQMVLKVAKNFSYYISYNNMKLRDMLSGHKNSNEVPMIQSRPKSKLLYTIVKDYKNDKIIFSDRIGQDIYSFTQPINKLEWTLHNEQKEILGYQCKKATTKFAGRDYIAWYSTEISIADGPYKFHGLPGLIFLIYDTNEHYKFNISSIKNNTNYFNTEDEFYKHIEISNKEYKVLKQKYREKPSSMMNSGGMTFPKEMLDMADKRAKEKIKYENNPIELTD